MPEKYYSKKDFIICLFLFLIVDLVLVCVWLFTERTNSDFMMHFSFALTISSIILSVLAIIMSIRGETKTQLLLDRIEHEADKIKETIDHIDILSSDVHDIKETTKEMYNTSLNKNIGENLDDNLDDSELRGKRK